MIRRRSGSVHGGAPHEGLRRDHRQRLPSGATRFQALAANELFLFKLHAPRQFIAAGEKNGAVSRDEMRFEVSRRIKEEFENGRAYYALNGRGSLDDVDYDGRTTRAS